MKPSTDARQRGRSHQLAISIQNETVARLVEDDASPGPRLILEELRDGAQSRVESAVAPPAVPNVIMAGPEGQAVAIWFSFRQGAAGGEESRLAVGRFDDPEDAELRRVGLFLIGQMNSSGPVLPWLFQGLSLFGQCGLQGLFDAERVGRSARPEFA
jgi:hypothetical protein